MRQFALGVENRNESPPIISRQLDGMDIAENQLAGMPKRLISLPEGLAPSKHITLFVGDLPSQCAIGVILTALRCL